MARKSNTQLRTARLIGVELRKGMRAQPVPAGQHKGSRKTREFGAHRWELRFAD